MVLMTLLRIIFGLSFILLLPSIYGQSSFKVLHFTRTSGFDHGTRENSLNMFQELGTQHGFSVDNDPTGDTFNELSNLQQYAVIIFSNTSGDDILNTTQRDNFEEYINNGGALIGIHAASDTYRHSTANGSNTGAWDWYAETLGGSVQENPNHTNPNYFGIMDKLLVHPITEELPDPWEKVEEYYYWENGYLDTENIDLLQVRSTGANSYDAPRPISWYKVLPGGGKSFYTALGHAGSNFTSDSEFQQHLLNAILWAADITSNEATLYEAYPFELYPNPTDGELILTTSKFIPVASYRILNISGKSMDKGVLHFEQQQARLQLDHLMSGPYMLELSSHSDSVRISLPFIIK